MSQPDDQEARIAALEARIEALTDAMTALLEGRFYALRRVGG